MRKRVLTKSPPKRYNPNMAKKDNGNAYVPVPRALAKGESRVPASEFYRSYVPEGAQIGVPLWWKRDVRVELGVREMLKERRRMRENNEYLARKISMLRQQNEQFRARMKSDEGEFRVRYGKDNALLKARLTEAELAAEENALIAERERLIALDRLNRERAERERAEALLRDAEILEARRAELRAADAEAKARNAAIDAETDREREKRLAADARRAELREKRH